MTTLQSKLSALWTTQLSAYDVRSLQEGSSHQAVPLRSQQNTELTSPNLPRDHTASTSSGKRVDELSLQYRVTTKPEIVGILRQLIEDSVLVSLHIGMTDEVVTTRMLALDAATETIVFDAGPNPTINRALEASTHITAELQHQRIRVLFDMHQATQTMHDGRPAFRMPLPSTLTRYQRRASYRARTPVLKPCTITLRLFPESAPSEIRIHDLCCGGLSFCVASDEACHEPGFIICNTSLKIPDYGTFPVQLEIRHTSRFRDGLDRRMTRIGCRFVALKPQVEAQIQRYVNAIEALRRRTTLEF